MRKIVSVVAAFILGCFVGHILITPAQSQQSAQTLQCTTVGPCSQYVVQVNSGRGFGRFQVFQPSAALDTSQMENVGAGGSVSLQFYEPYPRAEQTFTLSLTEP